MLGEIARLMAMRMSYEDPIRIAQLKLAELDEAAGDTPAPADDVRKFRLDELIEALPAVVAEPCSMRWNGWAGCASAVSIRFSTGEPLGHSPPEDRGVAAAVAAVTRCAMPRSGPGSSAGCT